MGKQTAKVEQLEEQVRRWISSKRGKKTIQKTKQSSDKTTKQLQDGRRIDPASLDRPFTV
jgi:hypothetical protein